MSTTSRLLLLPQTRQQSWSLRTVLHLLSSQQLTCQELARYCHATAVAGEDIWHLRAFSRLTSWETLQEAAQASDQRRKEGRTKSPLDGIPISVKANLAVQDQALTAASLLLGEGIPRSNAVGYNAALVHTLVEECGAICIGITNMDEFGMGSLGTNNTSYSKPTKNPLGFVSHQNDNETEVPILDLVQQSPCEIANLHRQSLSNDNQPAYSAGGSSCGAAASVAHGSSLVALGSDTGGSIRLPAAWCGIVGMKPSYGRISRHGLVSYASSLDTVGFLTRTVDCASLVMEEVSQKEQEQTPQDSTSHHYSVGLKATRTKPEDDEEDDSSKPLKGIKIGIPAAFVVEECLKCVQEAWSNGASTLQEVGATVVPIDRDVLSPEIIQQSLAAYYVLASAEASSNLTRYDGFRYGVAAETNDNGSEEGTALQRQYAATRTHGFGQEVIRRILCGTAVLSSDKFHTHYEAAAKLRALVTQQLHDALTEHVDYLLIPTVVSPPPRLPATDGEQSTIDSTSMFANDIMTVPISLAGLSAVNVPFAKPPVDVENVVGLQLVGYRLQEEDLLRVARWLEE